MPVYVGIKTFLKRRLKMSKLMKPADVARIQAVEAKKSNGKVSKEDFAARAQRTARKNEKK
jgi:hypothetical protein